MTDKVLRWGLLSTARINRGLIPPLRASKRNVLAAVASRNLKQADAYAQEWKIPTSFGSYEALLADPHIDVIYNPLPNSLHAGWTIRAAQAGKHVLCEKPMGMSAKEVDEIAAAARQAGVVVAEAFMYRHHPQTIQLRDMVRGGAVGTVRLIRGAFTFNLTRPEDVRLDPELGGGSIWDVGCYPISFARYILDAEPLEVFGWQMSGTTGIDEVFVGQMRFPGQVFAQFDSGFRSPFRAFMEIVGSEATLEIPEPFKPGQRARVLLRRGDQQEKIAMRGQDLYRGEVEDMADAVLLGKPPRISLADSRGNAAAIEALLRSARQGQPVSLA